jgi:putative ABC transport system permease protein
LLGGVLGAVCGIGFSHIITASFEWPTMISVEMVVLAIAFSGLVGLISGLYPARRAARLEPIEALRRE